MVETVNADLHRAIVGNGVYLKRPWNEFSGHLATDVVLHTLNQSLPSAAQAGLVVIELQVVGQQRSEFLQIAMVVGVEKFGIQRLDRLKEWVGCRRSLCVDVSKRCSKQSYKKKRLQRSTGLFHEGIPFCEVYAVGCYVWGGWIVPPLLLKSRLRSKSMNAGVTSELGWHFILKNLPTS